MRQSNAPNKTRTIKRKNKLYKSSSIRILSQESPNQHLYQWDKQCDLNPTIALFFVSTKRTVSAAIAGATEVPVRGANSNTHRPPQKKAGGLGDPTPETRQAGPPTSSAPATSSRSRRPARGLLFPLHPRRGSFPRGPRSP